MDIDGVCIRWLSIGCSFHIGLFESSTTHDECIMEECLPLSDRGAHYRKKSFAFKGRAGEGSTSGEKKREEWREVTGSGAEGAEEAEGAEGAEEAEEEAEVSDDESEAEAEAEAGGTHRRI
jgi:hypothetical protein